MPVIEHTFWLCPEHAEANAGECTCGLVPYVPKAEAERLRDILDRIIAGMPEPAARLWRAEVDAR